MSSWWTLESAISEAADEVKLYLWNREENSEFIARTGIHFVLHNILIPVEDNFGEGESTSDFDY